jgi:hypothetical protein
MPSYKTLSDAELDWVAYDAATGVFRWRVSRGGVREGRRAGSRGSEGYVQIQIKGKIFYAHRLAWRIAYGHWPAHQIDHINGDRADNRLVNLREATSIQNCQNMAKRSDNRSGYVGVSFHVGRQKWRAEISVGGKRRSLGYFADPVTAHTAYVQAKKQLHMFHPEVPQR